MNEYISKLINILSSFLGEPHSINTETTQLTFGCPRCIENKGEKERQKHNLEVNLRMGVFQCWSCAQYDDDMHGSIKKLIMLYGTPSLLKDYKTTIHNLKESKLYNLNYSTNDFNIEFNNTVSDEVNLPSNFQILTPSSYGKKALDYLFKRGINWDIINKHHIGYTKWDENQKQLSSRIILPSLNEYGELDYWTGRDFTTYKGRQKYMNPKIERKDIVFNCNLINWDADITLVEGPFDHIVVPNSIPLLGKVLKPSFKIYEMLTTRANANINIFLDGDAIDDAKKIYKLLNHNKLYNKIRVIEVASELDPSDTFKYWGYRGIINCLRGAKQIPEIYLG